MQSILGSVLSANPNKRQWSWKENVRKGYKQFSIFGAVKQNQPCSSVKDLKRRKNPQRAKSLAPKAYDKGRVEWVESKAVKSA